MNIYITPEEYDRAKENGVDQRNLERRIRMLGWEKERAINTPLRELQNHKKWYGVAKENGISYQTFMYRCQVLGWSYEMAASKPVRKRRKL